MTRPTHADLFCYLPLDTSLTDSLFSNRTDRTHREGPLRKPCRVLITLFTQGDPFFEDLSDRSLDRRAPPSVRGFLQPLWLQKSRGVLHVPHPGRKGPND